MVIRPMPNATAFTRPPAAFPMNLDVLPASCRQDAGSTLAGSLSVRRRSLGLLTTDLVIAMAILALAMIPLSYAVVRERQLSRALYYRALATEIVDCERANGTRSGRARTHSLPGRSQPRTCRRASLC